MWVEDNLNIDKVFFSKTYVYVLDKFKNFNK